MTAKKAIKGFVWELSCAVIKGLFLRWMLGVFITLWARTYLVVYSLLYAEPNRKTEESDLLSSTLWPIMATMLMLSSKDRKKPLN
ncbi:MAG: hypothetical protein ABH919_02185 [bacterium]